MIEDLRLQSEKAYNYAIYLLSLKLRTEGELREKMRMKKYDVKIIDGVIHELAENHYIDDQKYAEVYLDNLKKYKNFGFYGIKKKLMEKKLPNSLIESVLGEGFSVEDEIKIAGRLLKKEGYEVKVKTDDGLNSYQTYNEDSNKEKQKISNRLKARGFRGEVVARLIF